MYSCSVSVLAAPLPAPCIIAIVVSLGCVKYSCSCVLDLPSFKIVLVVVLW